MEHEYTTIDPKNHGPLEPCPLCLGKTTLWQYVEKPGDPAMKVVMCDESEALGDFDSSLAKCGCPMAMPDSRFYRASYREAIDFHRKFADAVLERRMANAKGLAAARRRELGL